MSEAFLTQYVSCQKVKWNNHHLFTIKIRQGDSLKSSIGYFQSQLAKIPNLGTDIFALAFISRLQISYPLYKYILTHNVTRMSEVLSRAQPYIQLQETMRTSANHFAKRGDDRRKLKYPHETAAHTQDRNSGQPANKKQALLILLPSSLRAYKPVSNSLRSGSPSTVFNTINDQSWIWRPRPIQYDLSLPKTEEYCSYRDSKGRRSSTVRASEGT